MENIHPIPVMGLPISLELYQRLLGAAASSGFKKEAWEIGADAIHDWLARNGPESFAMPTTSGYQWKHLFSRGVVKTQKFVFPANNRDMQNDGLY